MEQCTSQFSLPSSVAPLTNNKLAQSLVRLCPQTQNNQQQDPWFSVRLFPEKWQSAGRPAQLLYPVGRICSAGSNRQLLPRTTTQVGQEGGTFPSCLHISTERFRSYQKLCNKFPWGGKEVRLHFCILNNAFSRAFAISRAHLYFLSFLSFFSSLSFLSLFANTSYQTLPVGLLTW